MAGVQALRRVQLGQEGTAGTAVVATAVWRGQSGGFEDQREIVFADEDIGILQLSDRVYVPKLQGAITLDETPATFEQILYMLEGGIKKVATGVADGAGSGKIYAYPFPVSAANTIHTFTIEAGDDMQAEEMAYSHVSAFTISGKGGESLMMSSDWIGRTVATTTFTGDLAIPTVEEILFGKGAIYIDPVGSIGSTKKSNTLMEMSLNVETGLVPRFPASEALHFARVATVPAEVKLELTFEHDATAVAEKAAWRAGTARAVRLLFQGDALATAGTAYTYKSLIIDLYGKWESFDKLDEDDGNDIVKGTLSCRYNETGEGLGTITVVNELAALV